MIKSIMSRDSIYIIFANNSNKFDGISHRNTQSNYETYFPIKNSFPWIFYYFDYNEILSGSKFCWYQTFDKVSRSFRHKWWSYDVIKITTWRHQIRLWYRLTNIYTLAKFRVFPNSSSEIGILQGSDHRIWKCVLLKNVVYIFKDIL